MLKVGDRAPDVGGMSTVGRRLSLSEFRGQPLVVYFFLSTSRLSKACVQQAQRFRDNYPDIRELGAEVIGISTEALDLSCQFAMANRVTFPLIADDDFECSRAFGVLRTVVHVDKRVTFIIDEAGIIQGVFHHEVQVSKHLDDVLRFLRRLKSGEASSVTP